MIDRLRRVLDNRKNNPFRITKLVTETEVWL